MNQTKYIIQVGLLFVVAGKRDSLHQGEASRYTDKEFTLYQALRLAKEHNRTCVTVWNADTMGRVAEFTIYE